jgi:hypothetical protein
VLPEPLAGLVLDLLATRRASTIINAPGIIPWLFPGRRHGQPISPDQLGQRLKQIGIRSGRDGSTALLTLAAEIPAAILARLLGIHISVAWQRASAGDWMTYAADVSRRTPGAMMTQHVPVIQLTRAGLYQYASPAGNEGEVLIPEGSSLEQRIEQIARVTEI